MVGSIDIYLVVEICIAFLLLANLVLTIILLAKRKDALKETLGTKLDDYAKQLEKNELNLKEEFKNNRQELVSTFANFSTQIDNKLKNMRDDQNSIAKTNREDLASALKHFEENFKENISEVQKKQDALTKTTVDNLERVRNSVDVKLTNIQKDNSEKLEKMRDEQNSIAKTNREDLASALKHFEENFKENISEVQKKQDALTKTTVDNLERVRNSVDVKLTNSQKDNSEKLEKMRETVDEKLNKTLETRLNQSFKLVSERLEQVHSGLGEMQKLAADVGGLKKVLSNVKTKGMLGEYQLEGILEQVLTPNQYEKNVKTKIGSNDKVEYAIKIPSKMDSTKTVLLPIDAKFPTEDYERLMSAYENGNADDIKANIKSLETKIKKFAQDINNKYIDVPNTTEFAVMFLPFEGLYAEVLRIPGLFETIQRDYKVVINGPTTISAFLNSLQMGFRSLAIEKRTSEIWDLLGAVRTEFGKFGDVIQKTKEKIDAASREMESVGTRTRAIERKLRNVEEMPETQAAKLLTDREE